MAPPPGSNVANYANAQQERVTMSYWHLVRRNIGVYTKTQQQRLRSAKTVVCGLGGVGAYAASLLARLGVGTITCVDAGRFHASNINRQAFASTASVGQKKASFVAAKLAEINPYLSVSGKACRITHQNSNKIIAGHDVVLEAVDNLAGKVIIHRAARSTGAASITVLGGPRHRGFVSAFLPRGPIFEEVFGIPKYMDMRKYNTPEFRRHELLLRRRRARKAIEDGAPAEWMERFLVGQAPWATDVLRVHMVALLAVHEAISYVIDGCVSAPAPKAILMNLSRRSIGSVCDPPNGVHWDYAEL